MSQALMAVLQHQQYPRDADDGADNFPAVDFFFENQPTEDQDKDGSRLIEN